MRVALLGLGLIGGSIARGLPRSGGWSVAAWSPSGRGPAAALGERVVDAAPATPEAAIDSADLVLLAAPPLACLGLLAHLAGPWRAHLSDWATVTDVASTKAALVGRAVELGLPFVGGHPMAGRESTGYGAASPDLFTGRPWVVVPAATSRPADLERVEALAAALGARPVRMSADEHDAAVAAISHLPLLISAALVEAVAPVASRDGPDFEVLARLAATGWSDATRLARGDPAMGAGIMATNAGPVAAALGRLRTVLEAWSVELQRRGGPDAAAVEGRLADARRGLEAMSRRAVDIDAALRAPAPAAPSMPDGPGAG